MRQPDSDRRDFDLLVLGDINPDIVVADSDPRPEFGQHERLVDSIAFTIGGSSAILACGAARLGLRVAIIGVVGDDQFGRFMLSELAGRGVEVSACRIDPERPTGASVILARPTDRAILTASGTIAALRAEDVPTELIARSRHLHVGSYYLQTGLHNDLSSILQQARNVRTSTSIDPNWDPHERWADLSAALLVTDVFLPNEVEALRISQAATVEAAARILAAGRPPGALVVVKRGAAGAMGVTTDGEAVAMPGYPIALVDATGAGDSFDAAFLAAWLDGHALRDALAFAVVCGALSTRGVGGTATQPTRTEASAVLAGWSDA